eukprot:876997-Prymnesium_polylepis.2
MSGSHKIDLQEPPLGESLKREVQKHFATLHGLPNRTLRAVGQLGEFRRQGILMVLQQLHHACPPESRCKPIRQAATAGLIRAFRDKSIPQLGSRALEAHPHDGRPEQAKLEHHGCRADNDLQRLDHQKRS